MRTQKLPIILILSLLLLCSSTAFAKDSTNAEMATDSLSVVLTDTVTTDSAALTAAVSADNENFIYPMSEERRQKLIAYSQFNNIWRFVDFIIGLGIMALFLFTGLSAKIRDWSANIPYRFFALWAFIILFMAIDYLLSFPFNLYRNFLVEGEFGFINQTFGQWFGEELLGLFVGVIVSIIPLWVMYWLIKASKRWWLWFSVAAIPITVFFIVIGPVLISPLFNDYVPLKDENLKTELLALADHAGIENSDVFQVNASKQSSKINAYVTGLFGSKRIVLYDTMIDNFSTDEIIFVMGHEMGHYVMHHIWVGVTVAIFFIGLALWLTDKVIHRVIAKYKTRFRFERLEDYASLPLILAFISVIGFLFNPVTNSLSRYHEHEADIYGMNITRVDGETAATAFDKLSVFNLSDPDPHPFMEFWFYSHPSLKKRMEFVRSYHPDISALP